jgi:hypothetical protein
MNTTATDTAAWDIQATEWQRQFDKWATWAATATPAGTFPGSMDALDKATELAAAALDRRNVPFTMEELEDAINAAQ